MKTWVTILIFSQLCKNQMTTWFNSEYSEFRCTLPEQSWQCINHALFVLCLCLCCALSVPHHVSYPCHLCMLVPNLCCVWVSVLYLCCICAIPVFTTINYLILVPWFLKIVYLFILPGQGGGRSGVYPRITGCEMGLCPDGMPDTLLDT